ncbi:aminotransferase class IV [Adhaeribacter radiodurans]|uniref:branched-chain-amino-acid transaminase n=1 Tax=Adhaeribacter radiodurans TaxID=2745197 RepID=A0A7L7L7E6_9BACT|nr:aminotransferase class IV [Adhaeribacter radiodurans]QMU28730.1 aminotransferase class IV [Adhaeribacter radiodurans]
MYLLHNFKLISEENFSLSYTNRAFQYNDGLFETIILDNGRIRFLADHLERTRKALQVLQIQVPAELQNQALLESYIQELAKQNQLQQRARIKLHVWRTPDGLFTPEQNTAETLITLQPQASFPSVIASADFATTVQNAYSPLSFFKGPYAVNYVLASLEKKQKQLDELILLNNQGFISETLVANIFWVKEAVLYTPSLPSGCIAGIIRKNILRLAAIENLKVEEGIFSKLDLMSAETVFTSNVTGLRLIQFIGQKEFSIHQPVLDQLNALLFTK